MTPAARIQAAIEILQALDETALPADRFIRNWFGARRYAGSKDRAAVTERVYDVLRHHASYTWRMGRADARALVLASLAAENLPESEIASLFEAGAYGPAPLTGEERLALGSPPSETPPAHVQGEYPKWLEPELRRGFGVEVLPEMIALSGRAPVDLRVNTLRAARDDMLVGLRALGFSAEPTPFSPTGIRIPSGEKLSGLEQTSFFQTGSIEIQDEAAQIASLLCGVQPGQRVLDLAAGAGGKALALAARMQNRGEIVATDKDEKRLAQLAPRARRAGVTIIQSRVPVENESLGAFDVVLVDAPCSGSGSWRRNPEAKWRLTPERLGAMTQVQSQLLDRGAAHTRPGGRLVYASCSIFRVENEERIAAFLEQNPEFHLTDADQAWRDATGLEPPPGMDQFFRASPRVTGTDGFFTALFTRGLRPEAPPG